ncbi:MAG: hypothetical protein KDE31_17175, partial [Caldilineaceae bacterium]|nr:hypothetical protein [Caldilineaceae bacterium]
EQPSSDQPSLTQYPAGRQPSSAAQPQGQDRQDGHEARTGYPPRTAPSPSRRQPHQSSPTASTPSVKPQSRIPFWAGFALSFLLLTIASLGLLVLSTGVDRFDFSSLQGGESAWAPPEIIPTATIDAAQVGGVVASSSGGAYGTGAILRNVTGTNVRIRQTPGNLSKPDGDVIAGIPAGGRVEVIGGPSVVDGLTWWLIRYTTTSGQMIEGWSAEVTASGLRILGPEQ